MLVVEGDIWFGSWLRRSGYKRPLEEEMVVVAVQEWGRSWRS